MAKRDADNRSPVRTAPALAVLAWSALVAGASIPAGARSRLDVAVNAPQPYAVLQFDWEARKRLVRHTRYGRIRIRWTQREVSRPGPDPTIT